jgi:hypothetical protein
MVESGGIRPAWVRAIVLAGESLNGPLRAWSKAFANVGDSLVFRDVWHTLVAGDMFVSRKERLLPNQGGTAGVSIRIRPSLAKFCRGRFFICPRAIKRLRHKFVDSTFVKVLLLLFFQEKRRSLKILISVFNKSGARLYWQGGNEHG